MNNAEGEWLCNARLLPCRHRISFVENGDDGTVFGVAVPGSRCRSEQLSASGQTVAYSSFFLYILRRSVLGCITRNRIVESLRKTMKRKRSHGNPQGADPQEPPQNLLVPKPASSRVLVWNNLSTFTANFELPEVIHDGATMISITMSFSKPDRKINRLIPNSIPEFGTILSIRSRGIDATRRRCVSMTNQFTRQVSLLRDRRSKAIGKPDRASVELAESD